MIPNSKFKCVSFHQPLTFFNYILKFILMTTDIFLYKKDTTVTHSVRTRYRGATLVNNFIANFKCYYIILTFKSPIHNICCANFHLPLAFYLLQIIYVTLPFKRQLSLQNELTRIIQASFFLVNSYF